MFVPLRGWDIRWHVNPEPGDRHRAEPTHRSRPYFWTRGLRGRLTGAGCDVAGVSYVAGTTRQHSPTHRNVSRPASAVGGR